MPEEISFLDKLKSSLAQVGIKKEFVRGEFLLKEGQVENHIYLVIKGALRVFMVSDSEELTIRFAYYGSIITSLSSYLKGTPSEFYIQAIRKTTVLVVPKETIQSFAFDNEETRIEYIGFLEGLIVQQMEREIDLLTASPLERLKRALQRSPDLFQHIPLKYIASYLRMTPETLSRIRNS